MIIGTHENIQKEKEIDVEILLAEESYKADKKIFDASSCLRKLRSKYIIKATKH